MLRLFFFVGIGMLLLADAALLAWHSAATIPLVLSKRDRLDGVEAIAVGLIFGWVLFCVILNYIATVSSERRRKSVAEAVPDVLAFHRREAEERLLLMVPSYREEEATIWQTLMSAALAEHPARDVVLLIDDPEPKPGSDNAVLLANARALPGRLQAQFDAAAAPFDAARQAFATRQAFGKRGASAFDACGERTRIMDLYAEAALWLETEAHTFLDRTRGHQTHTDRLFADKILLEPARALRAYAADLGGVALTSARAADEYLRLSRLFRVRFLSFERKQFANLSHAPNKAMNLNTYFGLIGKSFAIREDATGRVLLPAAAEAADLTVPAYPFVVAVDADSMITHDYNLRLMQVMRAPGGERVAIAQSPYTAIPEASSRLEHAAAASTDGQYFSHQGLAALGVTSWVGAAALIRFAAMEDIKTTRVENGREVDVYIKDDILIEDAAATIDLLRCGWSVHHTDLRLTYSATPADFGSLIIQRRRWANGGLLLLPRVLDLIAKRPLDLTGAARALVRIPHLTSAATNGLFFTLMVLVPLDDQVLPPWMAVLMLPSLLMTSYDLVRAGYRWRDLLPVQALSVLLIPVNISGTWQSLRQAVSGRPVPFARTPKIGGRTPTPVAYLVAIYGFMLYALVVASLDLRFHLYSHAAFAAFNLTILAYCVWRFIGARNSWRDLCARWAGRRRSDRLVEALMTRG